MSDELDELRKTVELIERKTSIWRSQVLVLLGVFLTGWIASSLWMRATIEARVEKTERAFAEKRKTVEAERFVVRGSTGKTLAVLGPQEKTSERMGNLVRLTFSDEKGVEEMNLFGGGLQLYRPNGHMAAFLMSVENSTGIAIMDTSGLSKLGLWVEDDGKTCGNVQIQERQEIDFSAARARKVTP